MATYVVIVTTLDGSVIVYGPYNSGTIASDCADSINSVEFNAIVRIMHPIREFRSDFNVRI